jgi:uncharacterized protein
LSLAAPQVAKTISLLDEGNTLPFIARYRKELTGGMDEEQLRQLHALLDSLRKVDERREVILNSIQEQGLLTPELSAQLEAAESLTQLEDLYLPYKPKRRTRATMAREKGLQGLADLILRQDRQHKTLADYARPFLNEAVPNIEAALDGARDIVAEWLSDQPAIRGEVRARALKFAMLYSEKIQESDDAKNVFLNYYLFEGRVSRLRPYQILALNRGEAEKILRLRVEVAERDWLEPILAQVRPDSRSALAEQLELAIRDAAKRLLLPAIERDVRAALSEIAEDHAIQVFAQNLRGLLTQAPMAERVVLALDPAYRTGCKWAVLDPTGKVLETGAVFPHEPQRRWAESLATLGALIIKHKISLIAIGNGTASRETEALAAELTRKLEGVHYLMVNEAGASVYSASPLARQELPDLDVSLRGAVSIGRRVQDPLAELVKIEPKSIGVGLYQHDVNQKKLGAMLDGVVEMVVNQVGVDVNTASPALLSYVAGIGPKLAESIVAHREASGPFPDRKALKQVPKLGAKAFEQAAGFLRIRGGKNPLDASAIHPESYPLAEALLKQAGLKLQTSPQEREPALNPLRPQLAAIAQELGAGLPTLQDVLQQLLQPGRDPRQDMPAPLLRSDVLKMEDLKIGMRLHGTVRNVVDFGAFIDIGVKQDGLLHISQIPRDYRLSVGEVLEVGILSVEAERGRIGLAWVTDQT